MRRVEELWDIERVAAYLGVSERTVYNRVRAGELRAVKVGRLWRVKPSDLEAWLGGRSPERAEGGGPSRRPDVPGPYPMQERERGLLAAENPPLPTRRDLELLLAPLVDTLERRIAFVGLLTKAIELMGWPPPVIVGGHAVEYYTAGDYPTIDIDLAGASEPVSEVLQGWGFQREGRHWFDDSLRLVIEVPGSRPGPEELAHAVRVRTGPVAAYVLGVEDVIVDRLCSAKFWHDGDSRMWASVMLQAAAELDLEYLRRRASDEDVADELEALMTGGADVAT